MNKLELSTCFKQKSCGADDAYQEFQDLFAYDSKIMSVFPFKMSFGLFSHIMKNKNCDTILTDIKCVNYLKIR